MFGYIPDPPDDGRDFDAGLLLGAASGQAAPGSADLWRWPELDILDQGTLQSCVACAVLQGIRLAFWLAGDPEPLGARLWAYYLARLEDGTVHRDAGTHFRSTFRALTQFGYPLEWHYPYEYDARHLTKRPPVHVFRLAFDRQVDRRHGPSSQRMDGRSLSYHRIQGDNRSQQVRRALDQDRPVVIGTLVGSDFLRSDYDVLDPPRDPVGGHAMLVVGYAGAPNVFRVANSHGAKFGRDGFCLLSEGYIDWEHTQDIWVIEAGAKR